MTRIIAGLAKGRRLAVPDEGTRPTSDRAREGLFNSLAALVDLDGARVLDLYAGTGAVGLEALSRGAAHALLVESDRKAAAMVRRNVQAVALPGARLETRPVAAVLAAAVDEPFDIAFADPPYALQDDELDAVLLALADGGWLAGDGLVVVERSIRNAEPRWPGPLMSAQHKRYGETVFWYGRRQ